MARRTKTLKSNADSSTPTTTAAHDPLARLDQVADEICHFATARLDQPIDPQTYGRERMRLQSLLDAADLHALDGRHDHPRAKEVSDASTELANSARAFLAWADVWRLSPMRVGKLDSIDLAKHNEAAHYALMPVLDRWRGATETLLRLRHHIGETNGHSRWIEPPQSSNATADQPPALASSSDIAALIGQPKDRVDSFLRRYRKGHQDCFMTMDVPRRNEARYLYRTAEVLPAIREQAKRWRTK